MRQETVGNDGLIGLGVLALMVIALVAGEVHATFDGAGPNAAPAATEETPRVLIQLPYDPRSEEIEGAIRELRVFPMAIEQLDLGWASDETVIEEYRRTDF